VRNSDDSTLVRLSRDQGEMPFPHTPIDLQIKLINQELKRRYGVKPGKSVNENASGGASSAGAVAGVNNPASKKAKSKIGSLFGGTYKQSKAKK